MLEESLYRFRSQIILGLVGLGLAGAGLIMTKSSFFTPTKVEILGETSESTPSGSLVVEVSGSVTNPGVYELEASSRVEDALTAAGGLTSEADLDWIEKALNRAAKVVDGQKIYIPAKGEDAFSIATNNSGTSPTSGMVSINTASKSQLEALWGIGPATADKIIEARPFSSVEELLSKKILKSNVYEANKDKLTVY
ncbi:MAG: Competence protein ComEA helix-hairpin-helix repeat protein [Candidatus Woesebacteria bacterium GW2011_GWB1_43_14]|uniref:Competence protein ComEA helix-hairpin-helix repeat protein n=1 Tax=Candidatus Woesebacteria bacterium GW2011_GWB1_43_14 TaxID=1618578 RepID=A0A0G1DGR6_9BACT|nr:MAG: Competence protein ComEA helix-hairpin-helix repeat protein [Candidatus Woesebacteria bacterium GW2011_GWC1_42_9]KKS96884.1 MAG: Competence protein ComEA helix-hairpin-helix repeat protein [Candidatus Woesebacteria bacterium GW2011_GWB1_43_14]